MRVKNVVKTVLIVVDLLNGVKHIQEQNRSDINLNMVSYVTPFGILNIVVILS
jgi:hypothetical protein